MPPNINCETGIKNCRYFSTVIIIIIIIIIIISGGSSNIYIYIYIYIYEQRVSVRKKYAKIKLFLLLLILFCWYTNARYILTTTSVSHCYRAALMNERELRYLTSRVSGICG